MTIKVGISPLPTRVPGLNAVLGGGLPRGYSLLVAGPSDPPCQYDLRHLPLRDQ